MSRSDALNYYAKSSDEAKQCDEDTANGKILTNDCQKAKHQAHSLDRISGMLYLPRKLSENPSYVSFVASLKKIFNPYITEKPAANPIVHGDKIEYLLEGSVSNLGDEARVKLSGNTAETELRGVKFGSLTQGLYPLCTEHTVVTQFLQKITNHAAPSSCRVEEGTITSFDQSEYEYSLNDCEHIVFQDCSEDQRVSISTQRKQLKQHLTVFFDAHKYEVEIEKLGRNSLSKNINIRVNGEDMVWDNSLRNLGELQSTQRDQLQSQLTTNNIRGNLQRNVLQYTDNEENYLNHGQNYITNYKDGVVKIVSLKYGVTVLVDHERIEVLSYQHLFRNTACGLCGDLNGEMSADIKSSKMCIMSNSKLAAYSYMIEDGECEGIPSMHKTRFEKEQRKCAKKEVVPTKISQLLKLDNTQKQKFNDQ